MGLFGTSGIRGDAEKLFSDQFCFDIGRTFVQFLENHHQVGPIAVGNDTRPSSPRIKKIVLKGLSTLGQPLFDEGLAPVPAMNWILKASNTIASLMISGSHISSHLNGIKFYAMGEEITKEHEKEIEQIYENLKASPALPGNALEAQIITEDRAAKLYSQMLKNSIKRPLKHYKTVLDCANGAQSVVMLDLLSQLGMEVIKINCDPQGNFIARDTDTDDKAFIEDLKNTVVTQKADLGIAFDGDGDRVVFIDERGKFVPGEYSCSLIAKTEPGNKVVTTISASQVADSIGKPVIRTKVGSPYVIAAMKENEILFGFEQNGGAIFANNMYTRDGGTVVIKILSLFSDFDGSFSELVATLPKFYMSRTKVDCPSNLNPQILKVAKEKFSAKGGGEKVEELDGIKIWLDSKTWILFRPSSNAPEFRVFAESDQGNKSKKLLSDGIKLVKGVIAQNG